jgi:YHS domain-containing protein
MRAPLLWSLVVLFVAACGSAQPAATAPAPAASSTAPASSPVSSSADARGIVAPGEAKVGDKTLCMISKEEFVVKADSPKVEHEGKTYYFCCSGCEAKFKADPKKYLGK